MTWWEVEQIADYVLKTEESMLNWTLSAAEMNSERSELTRVRKKLSLSLQHLDETEKKTLTLKLIERIRELQDQIDERLKRPPSPNVSGRNLL